MALERRTIVAAALKLLDRDGLERLTMRRLADELGVQAPSIYWHFAGKSALLDEMADALLHDVARDPLGATDHRVMLRHFASQLRAALLAHRDGALVFAGTFVVRDNVLRLADAMIGGLAQAGFDARTAARTCFSLLYYVLGFVIEEQALARRSRFDANALPARLDGAVYPAARAALPHLADDSADARFDFGVDLIVAGLGTPPVRGSSAIEKLVEAMRKPAPQ